MLLDFVYMYVEFAEHENYGEGLRLSEGVVAVTVFSDYIRLENSALVVMKEGLLPDSEYFGKFACGKVFSVLFHFGLMSSFCVAAAAAVYADFTTDEGAVDEFF